MGEFFKYYLSNLWMHSLDALKLLLDLLSVSLQSILHFVEGIVGLIALLLPLSLFVAVVGGGFYYLFLYPFLDKEQFRTEWKSHWWLFILLPLFILIALAIIMVWLHATIYFMGGSILEDISYYIPFLFSEE